MALPFSAEPIAARVFKQRSTLESMTQVEIKRHCGLPQANVLELFDILSPYCQKLTTRSHAIPAETEVLGALSFFRSGSFQYVEGTVTGISQSSMSRALEKISNGINHDLVPQSIKFPNTIHEMIKTKQEFFEISNLPNVLGAIDGTHVLIKAPSEDEPNFVNRKGLHSINVQAICNANKEFTNAVIKWPGATHDSFIWRQSLIRRKFEMGEFEESWLIGDSGYPAESFLLTPYTNPTTRAQIRYNRSHKKSRSIIERTFGIWKARFRSMDKTGGHLSYTPQKVCKLISSTMFLHNYCIRRNVPLTDEDTYYLNNREQDDLTSPIGLVDLDCGVLTRENVVRNYFT